MERGDLRKQEEASHKSEGTSRGSEWIRLGKLTRLRGNSAKDADLGNQEGACRWGIWDPGIGSQRCQ